MDVTRRITRIARSFFADIVGFADLRSYQDKMAEFGGPIVRGYERAISIGLRIPDSIVDFLPNASDPNIACEYKTHGYDVLNHRLNYMASVTASFLNQRGFRALPIPAAERTDQENAIPTVSHKMIAHIAGLGWIGKNCLLITQDYGPRFRFISLLTDAPLEAVNDPLEERCGDCTACRDACPVGAITGMAYVWDEPREKRLDFKKCQAHFEELGKVRKHAVCGMCLYACPYGRKGR